ncbi:MAG: alpha/beta hydrolase, partial [Nitrosomonadaceae bacterium]|nr:alpha/beta hydrolase [Nitrosomonadaceae bacterium]
MQHTTRFRILLVTIVIATTFIVFALGPLLTAPAPTAVSTLSADFPVESVEIPSQQGVTVHGWLARGKPGGGVLLLVHSMRSNRMEMLSRARFLKDQGYSVLFI